MNRVEFFFKDTSYSVYINNEWIWGQSGMETVIGFN